MLNNQQTEYGEICGFLIEKQACHECGGHGSFVDGSKCEDCDGSGIAEYFIQDLNAQ